MHLRRIAAPLCALVVAGAAVAVAEPRAYPSPSTLLGEPLASPYRVHVARGGEASFAFDGPRVRAVHAIDLVRELPVAEERGGRVRVVVEGDGARALVWLDEEALAWSVARPVRLAGRGDAGVWLSTGAPVEVRGDGARRAVTYTDGALTVTGQVAARELTRVFPVSRAERTSKAAIADEIRVRPGGGLLRAGAIAVDVLARRGRWVEVEHRSRYLRIRGWVAAERLREAELTTSGTGSGFGVGMSHTDRVTVPAGACLYDHRGGQPVALQRVTGRRYTPARDGDWWQVYVPTPWGVMLAWGQWLGDDAGGAPLWARCDDGP